MLDRTNRTNLPRAVPPFTGDPTARLSVVLSARGRSGRLRARRIEELFDWAAAAPVGQNVKAPARIVRRRADYSQTFACRLRGPGRLARLANGLNPSSCEAPTFKPK